MGLSASQGKLLFMTARISNNEFQQQSIAFAKERLADRSQQANDRYLDALNSTMFQVISGYNGTVATYENLTYNQLTGYSSVAFGKQYLVKDNKNRTLVSSAVAEAFAAYNGDFNKFLEKLGYTQVDIDVKDDKNSTQAIHDAWDKYLVSVGKSIDGTEEEHILNFGFSTQKDKSGNTISYPTYNSACAYTLLIKGNENAMNNRSLFKDSEGYYIDNNLKGNTLNTRSSNSIPLTPVTLYQSEEGTYYDKDKIQTDDGGYYYQRPELTVNGNDVIFTNSDNESFSVSNITYEDKFLYNGECYDSGSICIKNDNGTLSVYTGARETQNGVEYYDLNKDEMNENKVYYTKSAGGDKIYLSNVKFGAFEFEGTYYNKLYASESPEGEIIPSTSPKDRITETTDKYSDPDGNIYAINDLYKDSHGYYSNRVALSGGYDVDGNPVAIFQTVQQNGTEYCRIVDDVLYDDKTGVFAWNGVDYETLYVNPQTGTVNAEQKDYINSVTGKSDDGLTYTITESMKALNYNGTTQEQRELYDYASALTEAYYNKDSAVGSLKFDAGMINYYRNLFNEMRANGYTTESDEANLKDPEWFINQLKTGKLHLFTYSSSEKAFVSTGINEDESIIEKEDKSKIAIAEQEYNNEMDRIEAQEKQFDMQLNRLEAEYQALTTERDSINNVIKNNIQKSFGTFSSQG